MNNFIKLLALVGGGAFLIRWMMENEKLNTLANQLSNALPEHTARWSTYIAQAAISTCPPDVDLQEWAKTIAAIMDRESRGGLALSPPNPSGTGDFGHGKGLMQIDDRFHEFARTGNWQDAMSNIEYGAEVLRGFYRQSNGNLQRAIAAYNAGPQALASNDPDLHTTGGDYSSDVLQKAASYKLEA